MTIEEEIQKPVPKPGSPEAVKQGCSCPVLDNHHGAGFPIRENGKKSTGYWMSGECQLHGFKTESASPKGS
jgi:hypothetical protein